MSACLANMLGGLSVATCYAECTNAFMDDVATRVQVTTDGHKGSLEVVEGVFGVDVDYAQLI